MDDYDDVDYDDSYWAELDMDTRAEEFIEDSWERTMELLTECGYNKDKHKRPLLGHLIKAWDRSRNDWIHNPTNTMLQQIYKNLKTLADNTKSELGLSESYLKEGRYDEQQQRQPEEPLYF